MRHPCQEGHHHAKGHSTRPSYSRRESLEHKNLNVGFNGSHVASYTNCLTLCCLLAIIFYLSCKIKFFFEVGGAIIVAISILVHLLHWGD